MSGLFILNSCGFSSEFYYKKGFLSAGKQPAARPLSEFRFTQLQGGILLIKAQINDHPDSLNFLLDTGSGGISIDSTIREKLHLSIDTTDQFVKGIGGSRHLYYSNHNSLKLPDLTIPNLNFHINDYTFISSTYGVPIDGIIGYSFLKDFIVYLNYDEKKIKIFSPGAFYYQGKGILLHPTITKIPIIESTLSNYAPDLKNSYYFDIGAGLNALFSSQFVNDSSLFFTKKQRKHRFVPTEAYGFSGPFIMTKTVIKTIQIGPYRFKKVPVLYFDDQNNVTSYPNLGGIIGNDLLRRFNTTLNYREGEIYLSPNKNYHSSFDYSYTGLTMNLMDGEITITRVMDQSPAADAGFREGDIIGAVAQHLNGTIREYHELLKEPGKKIPILIYRDGEWLTLGLKIKTIL